MDNPLFTINYQLPPHPLGTMPANLKIMNEPIPPLLHLASMIDAKESKLERTSTPFIRRRLMADLDSLVQRFQVEYQLCVEASGMADAEPVESY
jgi:hypothetical protein